MNDGTFSSFYSLQFFISLISGTVNIPEDNYCIFANNHKFASISFWLIQCINYGSHTQILSTFNCILVYLILILSLSHIVNICLKF